MSEVTQLPMPDLDYGVGDQVLYMGDPDNTWKVTQLRPGRVTWWAYAERNGTKQNFPAGVFTKSPIKKSAPPPVTPKVEVAKKKGGKTVDGVAALLGEAIDIEACWRVAEMAGMDVESVKAKIGHLSNGLQRMGIGNRLRTMVKFGAFEPASIMCTGTGHAADFIFSEVLPEFEEPK